VAQVPAAVVVLAAATVFACQRRPSFDEPLMDRTDGRLPELTVALVRPDAVAIDGKLDEPAWLRAASTGMLVSPSDGRAVPGSRVNARARFAWDGARLLVGVTVWDREPSSPFSRDDVDPHIWAKASGIELMLQPGDRGDNRDYFELQVDVGGAVWDTRFDDYNRPVGGGRFGHQEWQSNLERAVFRQHDRYSVELALPVRALHPQGKGEAPRPGEVWRANVYSFRDGQSDALAWSPLLGQGNFHRASRFGRLRFGGS
jgi:hypothetical protein